MNFQHSYPSPPRIIAAGGPVPRAIRAMIEADPELGEIRALRRRIEQQLATDLDRVDRCLHVLDLLSGDIDLEDGGDDEPSLCGAHSGDGAISGNLGPSTYAGDDGEDEHDGREPNEDDEPSLGSVGGTAPGLGMAQLSWSHGDTRDLEEENEHGGDVQDEPHDAEEDGDDHETGSGNGVTFDGWNYHGPRFVIGRDWVQA